MDDNKKYDIFGIDFGDGETSISWCKSDTITEPQIIELYSRKQTLSALGVLNDGSFIIGEDACQASNLSELFLRLKNKFINKDPFAAKNIIILLHQIRLYLEKNNPNFNRDSIVVVGCPSGFDDNKKTEYLKLFESAGFNKPKLVSESRAAFLYARESGELRLESNLNSKTALIIDAGSSTLDFTYINNMHEVRIDAYDFGINNLGAGLIEQILLDININRHGKAKKLNQILNDFPVYKARLEFETRRVKEIYFSRYQNQNDLFVAESSVKLYTSKPPITVDLICTNDDMDKALNTPQLALNGHSFIDACVKTFENCKNKLPVMPDIVLLTGGASRMYFIKDIVKKIFETSKIVLAAEPEFAIARGLSYAARVDIKTKGFESELDELLSSSQINDIVNVQINKLYKDLADDIVDYIGENIIMPSFDKWSNNYFNTINEAENSINEQTLSLTDDAKFKEQINYVINNWLNEMLPIVESKTFGICHKYGIPTTTFKFNPSLPLSGDNFNIDSENIINFNTIKIITDVVFVAVFASIMGGVETALIATGPVGLIIGGVLGLTVGAIGSELLVKQVKKANIPVAIRRILIPKNSIKNNIEKNKDKMAGDIYIKLKNDESNPQKEQLSKDIISSIKKQLIQMKENALLIIK